MFRRGRRLRANSTIRSLVRENSLSVDDFIYPVFVVEGNNIKKEISSLKGNYHWSVDRLNELVDELKEVKVKSVILFGIPDHKDSVGTEAYNENGIVQKAVRKLKELDKDLYVITDVCMCEYTSHGHCGILNEYNINLIDINSNINKADAVIISVAHNEYTAMSFDFLNSLFKDNIIPVLIDVKGILNKNTAEDSNFLYWRL